MLKTVFTLRLWLSKALPSISHIAFLNGSTLCLLSSKFKKNRSEHEGRATRYRQRPAKEEKKLVEKKLRMWFCIPYMGCREGERQRNERGKVKRGGNGGRDKGKRGGGRQETKFSLAPGSLSIASHQPHRCSHKINTVQVVQKHFWWLPITQN